MPKLSLDRNPKHTRHASGQGRVVLSGEEYYTGVHGTPEAEAKYLYYVGAWNNNGRRPLRLKASRDTIGSLCRAYSAFASGRFVKRGQPTSYARLISRVCDDLASIHEDLPISEFTTRVFKTTRIAWLTSPRPKGFRSRKTVNKHAKIVVDMLRWGVAEDVVHPDVHARIAAIDPLDRRDVPRADPSPKLSAPAEAVEATLARLSTTARDICRLMLATGMRPSEACSIRLEDLDRSVQPWSYRVSDDWNKTAHHGRSRIIFLGPKAQAILAPHVARYERSGGFVFRPVQGMGRNVGPYSADSLKGLVRKAAKRAGVGHWSPNQLRHNALSEVYRRMGPDHAKGVAGHASGQTTLIYIDPDIATADERQRARETAMQMG